MGVCCAGSGSPGGGSKRDEEQGQLGEQVTQVWVPDLPGGGVLWRLRSSGREARGRGYQTLRRGNKHTEVPAASGRW